MKNTNSILKKLLSVLCVVLMVSIVFSTVVTNVKADENEEEISLVSLNPDVATNDYIHMVWQENVTEGNNTQYEVMYVNNGTKNFENTLISVISIVETLIVEDDDYEDILEEINESLEKCSEQDYKHSIDDVHHAVKDLEKIGNTELINMLIDSVRGFAKTNILYAEYNLTFNNSYIQEAYNKFYLAIDKYHENNYDSAVNQFKNSYQKIIEAYEENNETNFVGVDFGKIVRISYTEYDSVLPSIYLNGTISVSWVEIFENSSHLMYARSSNNGVSWWYFDMNKYYGKYLSLIDIGLPGLPGFGDIIGGVLDFRELLERLRNILEEFKDRFKDWLTEAGIVTPIHAVEKPVGDGGVHGIIEIIVAGGGGEYIPTPPPDPKPDLTVTDISFSNSQPTEGDSITISAIISNIGSASATGANASVYVDGNLLTTVENINLNAYVGQCQINVPWLASPHGVYTVTVVADPFNGFSDEIREYNNEMNKSVTVVLPDLTVTSISFSKNFPLRDDNITIFAFISNIGEGNVYEATASFLVDDVLITTINNVGISGKAEKTITTTWTPTKHGAHNITVIAEIISPMNETHTDNNRKDRPISVGLKYSDTQTETYSNAIINGTTAPDAVQNVTVSVDIVVTQTNAAKALGDDTTEPNVNIISPTANIVSGTVTVEVGASDNVGGSGMKDLKLYIDGSHISTDSGGPLYEITYIWNTLTVVVSDGPHEITVVATDNNENSATAIKSLLVNNNPPSISSIMPSEWENGWSEVSADVSDTVISSTAANALAWITTDYNPSDAEIEANGKTMTPPADVTCGTWRVTYDTTGISQGYTYYVLVLAGDGYGKRSRAYTTVMLDKTLPSNPTTTVSASPTVNTWSNDNTVAVTWGGADDGGGSGVAGHYYCWTTSSMTVPTASDTWTTSTSCTSSALSDSANWYLHVRARDNALNLATDAYHIGPFNIDATAPTIGDNAPSDWKNTDVTVTLSANDGDSGSGLKASYYRINNGDWTSYTSFVTITKTMEGSYKIDYYSLDNVDNRADRTCYVKIDKTSPETPISISSSPSGWTNSNSFTVDWSNPAELSGVAGAYYKIDALPSSNTDGIWSTSKPITGITVTGDATHTLYIWLKDIAGNINCNNRISTTLYLDMTLPSAPFISSSTHPDQNTWYNNRTASFNWVRPTDRSGVVNYNYCLDQISNTIPGTIPAGNITSFSYTNLDDGIWYFHLRALDKADNWGTAAHYKVMIDTMGGNVELVSPANNSWANNSEVTFVWYSWDALSGLSGNYQIQISSDPNFGTCFDDVFSGIGGVDATNSYTYTFSGDGTYYWQVRAEDNLPAWGSYVWGEINIDTIKPTVSWIKINNDTDIYAIDRTVSISTDASDERSGLHRIGISNDNVSWNWYDATVSSYLLSSGDGTKTVYVKIMDLAENICNNVVSDSITLDLTMPTNPSSCTDNSGSVSKVWQNSYNNPSFSWLGASDTNGIDGYNYYWGNDPYGSSDNWNTTGTFNPSPVANDGIYYLRISAVDVPGNVANWRTVFVFKYDTHAPTDLNIQIGDGSGYTNNRDVVLSLSAFDAGSGVEKMMISKNADFSGASWETFSFSKTWTLSDGDGSKTIYFKVKDRLGYASIFSKSVVLDRVAPGKTNLSSPGNDTAYRLNPTFTWGSVSDSSGINHYIIQTYQMGADRIIRNRQEFISYSNSTTLSLDIGSYYYRIRAVDNAGNIGDWSEVYSFAISNKSYIVYISVDGGQTWQEIEQGANYNFEWSGTDLMYKIVLVDPEAGTNVDISINVVYGFVSDFVDTDDDGLSDWEEAALYETNWRDEDCDDDGLLDGEEVNTYNTDPNDPDTDNDKILDGWNVTMDPDAPQGSYYCPPLIYDTWVEMGIYHDGYVFLGELSYGTNASSKKDTDGDGMWDGWEAYYGTKPTISDANEDYDYDNLTNIQEYYNKTHPLNPDTDDDFLNDKLELEIDLDPLNPDFDGDGVRDGYDLQPWSKWETEYDAWHTSYSEGMIKGQQYFDCWKEGSDWWDPSWESGKSLAANKINASLGDAGFGVESLDYADWSGNDCRVYSWQPDDPDYPSINLYGSTFESTIVNTRPMELDVQETKIETEMFRVNNGGWESGQYHSDVDSYAVVEKDLNRIELRFDDGYLYLPFSAPIAGTYTFIVNASSYQTSGAELTLLIDNNISQTLSISTVYSTYTALNFDFNLDVGVHELKIKAHNPIYTSSSKKYPVVDNVVIRPPNLGDKYYYTMFKASLQPDVEQTLRIQFSIDSEHDFSFIHDNRYLLPGFRVTMFENVSSDNLYIVDYTGKSIYSNVYKGTPIGPNGYQVDVMIPLDYTPPSQVEDRVFQITPMWLSVNGSEYPLVAPLNANYVKFASFTHLVGFGIPHILYIKPSVDFDNISIVVNGNMNNITGSGTYVFGGYTIFVINGSWSDYYSDSVLQNEFKTVAGTGNDTSNTPVDAVLVLSKNSKDLIDIPYSISDSWSNVWTDFSVAGVEALKLIPDIIFDARVYLAFSFLKASGVERINLGGVSGYGLFVTNRGYTVVGMKTADYIDITKTLPVLTKKTNMVQASCYEGGQYVEYLTITNEKVLTPEESRILAGNTGQMQAAVKWIKAGAAVMVIGVGVWQGWEVWTGDYDDTTKTIQLTLIAVETGVGVYYGIHVGEKVAIKTGMVNGKVVGIPYASVASVVIGWVECGRHLQIATTIDRSTYVGEMRYRSEIELAFGSAIDGGICALPFGIGIVAEGAWLGGMLLGNWLFKSDVPVVSLGTALIITLGNLLNIPTSEQMEQYRKQAYEDFKDYLPWRNCYMTSNPQIFVG